MYIVSLTLLKSSDGKRVEEERREKRARRRFQVFNGRPKDQSVSIWTGEPSVTHVVSRAQASGARNAFCKASAFSSPRTAGHTEAR